MLRQFIIVNKAERPGDAVKFRERDRQKTKIAIVNGAELHYGEAGKGASLVFVHGSLSDLRTWSLQLKFFSKHFHVLVYSRRCHYPGPCTPDAGRYSLDVHSEDLARLITTLGPGPVHLIGSSYGAYACLLMAAARPELVRTLVIGEPPVLPLLKDDPQGAPLLTNFADGALRPAKEAFEAGDTEAGVRLFFEGVTGKGSYDKLPEAVRTSLLQNAGPMKAEMAGGSPFPPFTLKDAERIQAPCLLLTGESSPAVFHRITEILGTLLPRTERATVPDASHSMHSDNPKAYNQIVMNFLLKADSGIGQKK
jgi:pimeloyl-ACP methyl ester carboxylesterase